jgi:lipoate-protein ligase A
VRIETVEIYFDKSTNPVENLRREEELFRRVESGELPELVRFWVNSECLVRGKARSVNYGWYHEAVAQKMGVMVIERATGGGVVYHDEGNLNWSFFLRNAGPMLSPTKMFEQISEYVTKALGSLGVEARFAQPNRIDVQGRKVSGMAARSTPKARLVHGTLLLNANLEKLNRLCIPPPGCPPVSNVSEWVRPVEADDVVRAFVKSLSDSGVKVRIVPKPVNLAK